MAPARVYAVFGLDGYAREIAAPRWGRTVAPFALLADVPLSVDEHPSWAPSPLRQRAFAGRWRHRPQSDCLLIWASSLSSWCGALGAKVGVA